MALPFGNGRAAQLRALGDPGRRNGRTAAIRIPVTPGANLYLT
jgi:hypothetical protein